MAQRKKRMASRAATKSATRAAEAARATAQEAVKTASSAAQENTERTRRAATVGAKQAEAAARSVFAGYGQLTAFGQAALDAYVKSGATLAKGLELLSREMIQAANTAFEANLAATRKLMGARTLREAVEVQSDFARERCEAAMAEAARLTKLSVEVANEAAAPIHKRVTASAERLI